MQKISKKMLLVGLLVLLSAMLLAGCGEDTQTNGGTVTVGGDVAATVWQSVGDTKGLKLLVDEKSGDYTVQIPQFKDANGNEALGDMNTRLQEIADEYEASKTADGLSWEVLPLVVETDNYLSVVLYQAEWPNYGTDGTVTSYIYDKNTKSEVSDDLAISLSAFDDDEVAGAIIDYCANTLSTDGVECRWLAYDLPVYYVDTDGKVAAIIPTDVKMVAEGEEVADRWHHLLIYKDGKIVANLVDTVQK